MKNWECSIYKSTHKIFVWSTLNSNSIMFVFENYQVSFVVSLQKCKLRISYCLKEKLDKFNRIKHFELEKRRYLPCFWSD